MSWTYNLHKLFKRWDRHQCKDHFLRFVLSCIIQREKDKKKTLGIWKITFKCQKKMDPRSVKYTLDVDGIYWRNLSRQFSLPACQRNAVQPRVLCWAFCAALTSHDSNRHREVLLIHYCLNKNSVKFKHVYFWTLSDSQIRPDFNQSDSWISDLSEPQYHIDSGWTIKETSL